MRDAARKLPHILYGKVYAAVFICESKKMGIIDVCAPDFVCMRFGEPRMGADFRRKRENLGGAVFGGD